MFIKDGIYRDVSISGLTAPILEGTILTEAGAVANVDGSDAYGIVPENIYVMPPTKMTRVAIGGVVDLQDPANENVEISLAVMEALGKDFNFVPAEEKLNTTNTVTPEMFGAVGDGTTDDSEAIQKAIASSKNVVFAQKTYLCGGIELLSGRSINLNGATLKANGNNPIFTMGATSAINRIRIFNGTLEGTSNDNSLTNQSLIYLACFYSEFYNLRISNAYNGIYIHNRQTGSGSLVENTFKSLKFNNCYHYAILTDTGGESTDGMIDGVFISCPLGSVGAIYIGASAGWNISNIHTYGTTEKMVELRNASHCNVSGAYIEGGYSNCGMLLNVLGEVNITNSTVIAYSDNTIMFYVSKSSSGTLEKTINAANLTLECNVDDITVTSITGTIDKFYCSRLSLNNPYGSIQEPEISIDKPIVGKIAANSMIISGGNEYAPALAVPIQNTASFNFTVPVGSGSTERTYFELNLWGHKNYNQGAKCTASIKGYLVYRSSTYTLVYDVESKTDNMTSVELSNVNNVITASFVHTLASFYGLAAIKFYPEYYGG